MPRKYNRSWAEHMQELREQMALREQLVLGVVWACWSRGRTAKFRDVRLAAGYAVTTNRSATMLLDRLVEQGYIKRETVTYRPDKRRGPSLRRHHVYTRGERLAGIDARGRPLRAIDETKGWL